MSFFKHRVDGLERQRTAPALECAFGLATLVELFDGDAEAITGLLEAARASIARDLEAIVAGAQAEDRQPVVEAAHRIRGTSGSIGAHLLIEISARIEAAVARPGATVAPVMFDELRAAVEHVSADIAAYTRRTLGPD